jgi:hypothetical protein
MKTNKKRTTQAGLTKRGEEKLQSIALFYDVFGKWTGNKVK